MSVLNVIDASSSTVSLGVGSGAGSSGDPFFSPAAVRIGATSDAAVAAGGGSGSVIAQLRRIILNLEAVATGIAKAEDAAHSSGDTGAFVLSKRTDSAATSAGTDGDYATFNTDANGCLWTRPNITVNSGTVDSTTQRVVLATDVALPAGTATIGNTKDAGPSWTPVHGVSGVPFTSSDQHSAAASVSDAPTSGQKVVVTDIFVSADTAMNVTFKCETSAAVIFGPVYMAANTAQQFTPRSGRWKLATADKKLQVITSVAGNIMVDAHYYSEA